MKVKFANKVFEVLYKKDVAGLTMYAVEDEPNHIDWLINVEVIDAEKKELREIEKNTDVNHEYFSKLLENDDSKDINYYAYQVAYCMSHDWIEETATWDDVQKACKLGAEWKEKHLNNSLTAWSEEDVNKPNGGIVMEDFNDGNGFYKVNLAYLNEEQVEEIEELVKRWDCQPKENEDDSIISDLLDYFEEDKCLKHEIVDIVEWLRTIKSQQKQRWSDNEKKMLCNLIVYLDNRKDLISEVKDTYVSWLKSLKNRVLPQPKQEWSEEDEVRLQACLDTLQAKSLFGVVDTVMTEWLKSLKERIGG